MQNVARNYIEILGLNDIDEITESAERDVDSGGLSVMGDEQMTLIRLTKRSSPIALYGPRPCEIGAELRPQARETEVFLDLADGFQADLAHLLGDSST